MKAQKLNLNNNMIFNNNNNNNNDNTFINCISFA